MEPPARYRIKSTSENERFFKVHVLPKDVSMRARFDIKLHEAGWNTRADMAQHKNALARLGTPSVDKDKHVKTPFVQKNGAHVDFLAKDAVLYGCRTNFLMSPSPRN